MADIEERTAVAERTRVRLDRWVTLSCVAVALALAIEHARALDGAAPSPVAATSVQATPVRATAAPGNPD